MNETEARALLAKVLAEWRLRTHADLAPLVDAEPATGQLLGSGGGSYQLEIQVFWDRDPGGDIRVMGAIDDGGIRAFAPWTDGFIMTPEGRFLGEDSA
jgi:hypothetical protein